MRTARWFALFPAALALASTSPAHGEFHLNGVDLGSNCHEVTATEVAAAGAGAVGTLLLFVYTPNEDVELKVGAGYVFAQSALDLYKTGKYAFAKCPQPPASIKNLAGSAPQSGTPNQGVVVMAPKANLPSLTTGGDSSPAVGMPARKGFFDGSDKRASSSTASATCRR